MNNKKRIDQSEPPILTTILIIVMKFSNHLFFSKSLL